LFYDEDQLKCGSCENRVFAAKTHGKFCFALNKEVRNMLCPKCGKETPSVVDYCEHCKGDLRVYHDARAKVMEGTGEGLGVPGFKLESKLLSLGPIGGIIMMAIAVAWFLGGLVFGAFFFYAPILFVIGLVGFLVSLIRLLKDRSLKKKLSEIDGSNSAA
jgi:hypothetical protein